MSPRDVVQLTADAAPLVLALVALCWIASLVRRDSSLVDRIWGLRALCVLAHHHGTVGAAAQGGRD